MKKILCLLCVLALCTGCQSTQNTNASQTLDTDGKTLVAYFTWADNTVVENEEESLQSALEHYESVGDSESVDTTSSASILQPGNTAQIATWIQEDINADLFSIQVKDPYPSNYDDCLEVASEQQAQDARPELVSSVENIDEYDTIFLGYPNWWYTIPMPIYTFLEENDVANKNIVLFCCHGTGGLGHSVEDIQEVLGNRATINNNVLSIDRSDVPSSQKAVQDWLEELGY